MKWGVRGLVVGVSTFGGPLHEVGGKGFSGWGSNYCRQPVSQNARWDVS